MRRGGFRLAPRAGVHDCGNGFAPAHRSLMLGRTPSNLLKDPIQTSRPLKLVRNAPSATQ
eukprot:13716179-Alexandrium_andersonii.AAC.1